MTTLRRSNQQHYTAVIAPPPLINDDEAERRESRVQTTGDVVTDSEGLSSCMQLLNSNKVTRQNVWQLSLIDNFSRLIDRHFKSVGSLQTAGSMLEASSRLYGLRVDFMHRDVMSMATGLIRVDGTQPGGGDVPFMMTMPAGSPPLKRPRRRANVAGHTVTRNKDTINARLVTVSFIEPTFAKLNTVVGAINSVNNLFACGVLGSVRSELKHFSQDLFWDEQTRYEPIDRLIDVDEHDFVAGAGYEPMTDIDSIDIGKDLVLLTGQLQGYQLTDTPTAYVEDVNPSTSADDFDQYDNYGHDLLFDMDAEPVQVESTAEYSNNNNNAVARRPNQSVMDVGPVDLSSLNLEYSYRPLDNIRNYWAGPSFWKFNRSVVANKSGGGGGGPSEPKKRKVTSRRVWQPVDMIARADDPVFISVKSRAGKRLRKRDITKNWDETKLMLPTVPTIQSDYFDRYRFAPGLIKRQYLGGTVGASAAGGVAAIESSKIVQNETMAAATTADDVLLMATTGATDDDDDDGQDNDEIAIDFDNAPERVSVIDIPFAKRNKVIDMKQLKRCCWSTITKQCFDHCRKPLPTDASDALREAVGVRVGGGGGSGRGRCEATTFKRVLANVPKLLTKQMQEAVSPAIAFLSVLHLASEQKLRLVSVEDNRDFLIVKDDRTY